MSHPHPPCQLTVSHPSFSLLDSKAIHRAQGYEQRIEVNQLDHATAVDRVRRELDLLPEPEVMRYLNIQHPAAAIPLLISTRASTPGLTPSSLSPSPLPASAVLPKTLSVWVLRRRAFGSAREQRGKYCPTQVQKEEVKQVEEGEGTERRKQLRTESKV